MFKLDDYKSVATESSDFRDRKLTTNISLLRQNHALWSCLAVQKLSKSRAFIIKCQEIMDSNDTDNEDGVLLDAQQEQDLWDLALEFLGDWEGLKLAEDDFVLESEKSAFRALNANQLEIEEKFIPRQELIDGLDEWAKMRNLETLQKKTIHNFMNEMQKKNALLKEKYTKSAISFRDLGGKKEKRIFYIYSINKNNEIKISFAAVRDQRFISKAKQELGELVSRTDTRADGWGLSVTVPEESVLPGALEKIVLVAKNYALFFQQEDKRL